MALTAVLMNDTRGHPHFGCDRVMRVIETNLESRGIAIGARSLVRSEWWNDRPFLEAAAAADIIVINGEGTCHHASRHAEKLLKIVDHPVRGKKPVALINALYQDNPPEWRRYLDRMDVISPRDSWSAAVLTDLTGRPIEHIPDLSTSEGFHPLADKAARDLLTIGESVVKDTRNSLIAFSRACGGAHFLPIVTTLKGSKPEFGLLRHTLRELYIRAHADIFKLRNRHSIFASNEFEYADYLLRSFLHISGRFHAICFSLTTKTPFFALASNAWKIEALLDDMGIDKRRIVKAGMLQDLTRNPQQWAFTPEEQASINTALARGVSRAQQLFDSLARLAREKGS